MNSKWYDILKPICMAVLPGLATLVLTVSGIWGLPYGEQIAGTITAVATFLGTVLIKSSKTYWENLNSGINEDGEGDQE